MLTGAGLLGLVGCATYSDGVRPVENALLARQPQQALAALEKQRFWPRDRLLYLLDKAMLLRINGDYRASNAAFEEAKQAMDKLDALSLREQAGAVSINDAMRSYAGEPFERVMVHLYGALNYLDLGEPGPARVEALQLDVLLKDEKAAGAEGVARYLSGMLFEQLGEFSDAMIAYRKAYEAYRRDRDKTGVALPDSLKQALLRLSAQQGLHDEHRRYAEEFPGTRWASLDALREQGEVVLLVHSGLLPHKREQAIHMVHPGTGQLVRIATPYYEQRSPLVGAARLSGAGTQTQAESVADVGAVAAASLQAQMPGITARALSRVVVKHQVTRGAEKKDELVGLISNVAGVVTERADTRAWYTLPQQILLARLALPPGRHDLKVELYGTAGALLATVDLPGIEVAAGAKQYRSVYWPSYRMLTTTRRRP